MKRLLLNEKFILLIILFNSFLIFIQGFDQSYLQAKTFAIADHIFTVIFLLELLVKLSTYGVKSYFKSSWNSFDFVLVALAVPSLVAFLLPINGLGLEFLLAFRIMRVFKFFRFIKFVPKINKIIEGVRRAMRASVLIIFAFFIFNFTIALVSTFIFQEMSPDHFGNPLKSLYSIFKIFTIEGWYEIPDEMTQNEDSITTILIRSFFILILLFGGVFGLSLVNSIFVDSMVSDNNDDLENKIDLLTQQIVEMNKKIK